MYIFHITAIKLKQESVFVLKHQLDFPEKSSLGRPMLAEQRDR
jgi:hypothetical protein